MAQVAWSGVQPFPLGGGEASAAQEPQSEPQLEVVPKATPKATSPASPVTSPILEVSKEEDGVADADYAIDMTAAQSTWDPWPIMAQDIPLPAQDASSSPLDEPTTTQDEP